MKKILFLLAIIIGAASCQQKAGTTADNSQADSITDSSTAEEEVLAFDSIEVKDSSMINENNGARCSMKVVFPVSGNKQLCDSIRKWICDEMGDTLGKNMADIKGFIKKSVKDNVRDSRKDVDEMVKDALENDADMNDLYINYETEVEIVKVYEDDDYVTLLDFTYNYMGGAHGMAMHAGMTFSKHDGHRCGWELVKNYKPKELRRLIREDLKDYFDIHEKDKAVSDAKLRENLFGKSLDGMDEDTYYNDFPLPGTTPWLTKEGVVFLYQQYEIAAYAAGMPTSVIPFKK